MRTEEPTREETKTMLDFLNEVSIEEGHTGWSMVYSQQHLFDCNYIPQEAGRRYAKWHKEHDQWITFDTMTKDQKQKFDSYDQDFIMCKFDNGDVCGYNDNFPRAVLTHVYFIPHPPKEKDNG